MLLILPVFFLMLFCIMEVGNIAFQTILINHCTYELARIGSLVAGPTQGTSSVSNVGRAKTKMQATLQQMFPGGNVSMQAYSEVTLKDPPLYAHANEDLTVTVTYKAKLIFPGSSVVLATPNMKGYRQIIATVRMPIEKPVFQ